LISFTSYSRKDISKILNDLNYKIFGISGIVNDYKLYDDYMNNQIENILAIPNENGKFKEWILKENEKAKRLSGKKIKVSIIVPVFNVEEYLVECLDSLVKQQLEDIEIICVNDGSTDDSLKIIKDYGEPRLTVN
jgi:hypothetical protein